MSLNCKYTGILCLLGVTKDPVSQDFCLVLSEMEWNLWRYCTDMKFTYTWYDVYTILYRVARGLEATHAIEIVHGDLHPGNILCSRGDYRLADFGLSGPPQI